MIIHDGKISLIICNYCGEVIVTVAELLPITKCIDMCADCAIYREQQGVPENDERLY